MSGCFTSKGHLPADLPLDAHDEHKLGLAGNIVGAILLAQSRETDLLTLCIAIFLHIGLGTLENDASLLFRSLAITIVVSVASTK